MLLPYLARNQANPEVQELTVRTECCEMLLDIETGHGPCITSLPRKRLQGRIS